MSVLRSRSRSPTRWRLGTGSPGRVSVNTVVIDALAAEVDRVKADKRFMAHLRHVTNRDKEILDRLAQ
ncbi:MAG: hypothetical protein ACYDH5_20015 [Acidimicrobiales bacterium]